MTNKCPECAREHNNPKFCSRSCSAKHNNRKFPKRKPEGSCKDCGTRINNQRSRCRSCFARWQHERVIGDSVTLEEAVARYKKHHKSSAFALVRTRARSIMKGVKECEWCGYDKHVEVAHRRGISTFTGDTLLSVINKRDNLVALCPNCHWEHDKLGRRE